MAQFTYRLNQDVELVTSNERGRIIGRAEYTTDECRYLIRYRAADGRQVEDWWQESAIISTC